ncbi:AraC-like DNA-binding protein [Aquimarina sp. MAR_2010_214]|uniref:helix-turn-helix domain-containing protein n=1 Tax=Aquimarina sp. MAR_2010_214 TaxID=1250026 RepID=UPI000CB41EED|nr:helix-turn-helix domain-containing protein [Aquimarina sp. MAR_2010_214]PKV51604.1 AraC-like DNA-binding protein [Aquimarina sp. MAR_2010_214]
MYRFFIYYFLLQFLFTSTSLTAQHYTDSLQQKSYDELIETYLNYSQTNRIKSKKIAEIYLEKAKKNKDTLQIAEAYLLHYYETRNSIGIQYLDSIIKTTKNKQNKKYPAYAYFNKAQYFLYKKREIENTLNNLAIARKFAKTNYNTNLLHRIEYLIGIVKSEHLDEKEGAISIFKKCMVFYANEEKNSHKSHYFNTIHAIAETYIGLKKYDSASYYNTLGYHKTSKNTDLNSNSIKTYFILCEGINQYAQKKYTVAIDSIHKALPKMIEFQDKSNIIDSYFYLGKSYHDLNNKEKAIFYFKKTDSLLKTLNSIPQYKHVKTYEYLKEHYKNINDIQNQNIYLNRLNSILDQYLNDRIFISKKVKEDYDIPLLIEEQEKLIKKLNKNAGTYISSIILLAIILITSIGLLYYQYRKKRVYRLRFEKLMTEQTIPNTTGTHGHHTKTENPSPNKSIKVPEKHITYILNKLDEFENDQKYLSLGISAQSLADDIKTNVKYLSLVINHYKNKSFINYLNELRITYAVKELKENTMIRKFTIKAIANEMGYNSAETFSNAFYKQTGIKPSFFIKNLKKNELNH